MEMVTIFDQLDGDGRPRFSLAHPRLSDEEREAVSRYLDAGRVVAATTALEPDVLAPLAAGQVVPQSLRSDGEWLWSDEITYYVRHHAFSPHEPFLAYLRDRRYEPAPVSEEQVQAALSLVGLVPKASSWGGDEVDGGHLP